MADRDATLECRPVTPQRLGDVEAVFAECADADRCWCAFWRRERRDFRAGTRDGSNRALFRDLVEAGETLGLVGYRDGRPVAWCGVAPRAAQPRLARSRNLAPVDGLPVWSITCFVTAKSHRRTGLLRPLVAAAARLARSRGAPALEAYPIDAGRRLGSGEIYTGVLQPFLDLGFREVARRSPTRPIVRLDLTKEERR
ncbi:GNAT family N-acetyltransferase [Inquilinus limosus]|uniref:GNAT family N-acetyltransferase n=1 Tax=Inquilinus limosus TaxID=171674 RepID=UPI0004263DE3|nr:GNAT family N-acetyltransferase [Inquilinus limosus]